MPQIPTIKDHFQLLTLFLKVFTFFSQALAHLLAGRKLLFSGSFSKGARDFRQVALRARVLSVAGGENNSSHSQPRSWGWEGNIY